MLVIEGFLLLQSVISFLTGHSGQCEPLSIFFWSKKYQYPVALYGKGLLTFFLSKLGVFISAGYIDCNY
jgi:hypothetical protein